jgi:hypothetical protein
MHIVLLASEGERGSEGPTTKATVSVWCLKHIVIIVLLYALQL